MYSLRNYIGIVIIILLCSSCTRKICPAYESYFLLNEQAQLEYFSPFVMSDSSATPKEEMKTHFDANGMAQGPTPKNFRKKYYKVPMKDYLVVPDDSTMAAGDTLALPSDTTGSFSGLN